MIFRVLCQKFSRCKFSDKVFLNRRNDYRTKDERWTSVSSLTQDSNPHNTPSHFYSSILMIRTDFHLSMHCKTLKHCSYLMQVIINEQWRNEISKTTRCPIPLEMVITLQLQLPPAVPHWHAWHSPLLLCADSAYSSHTEYHGPLISLLFLWELYSCGKAGQRSDNCYSTSCSMNRKPKKLANMCSWPSQYNLRWFCRFFLC